MPASDFFSRLIASASKSYTASANAIRTGSSIYGSASLIAPAVPSSLFCSMNLALKE